MPSYNDNYNKKLKNFSRELRTESVSRAEKFLWKSTLSRGQSGTKFKRQRAIDNFIVDFFSQETGLIIEVDGNSHFNKAEYDEYRQNKLQELGYTFLRFDEGIVLNQISDVAIKIEHAVFVLKEGKKLEDE